MAEEKKTLTDRVRNWWEYKKMQFEMGTVQGEKMMRERKRRKEEEKNR